MRVAAVNIRLDTYMHHLSEPARRMWRDRLMANIDQLNVFALGGCVCVYTFENTTFAVRVLIFPSIAIDLPDPMHGLWLQRVACHNGLTRSFPCLPLQICLCYLETSSQEILTSIILARTRTVYISTLSRRLQR